jgi:hypothetical protein
LPNGRRLVQPGCQSLATAKSLFDSASRACDRLLFILQVVSIRDCCLSLADHMPLLSSMRLRSIIAAGSR